MSRTHHYTFPEFYYHINLPFNKVLYFRTDIIGDGVAASHYAFGDFLLCVLLTFHREGWRAGQELVGKDTYRPPVDRLLAK